MKAILKQELKRAFTSRGFFLAVLLGAVLAVSHIFMFVIPQASQLEAYMEADKPMLYPGWLFSVWLGGNSYSVQSFLLLLLIPFLAVLPFGDSFFTDVTRGFAKNIYIPVSYTHLRWTGVRIKPAEAEELSGIHDIRFVEAFSADVHNLAVSGRFENLYLDQMCIRDRWYTVPSAL